MKKGVDKTKNLLYNINVNKNKSKERNEVCIMENKMTYVMALDNALVLVTDVATREKLEALKVQLQKKSKSGSSKPTKRQVENAEVLQPAVLQFLATVEKATATQVAQGVNVPFEVTTSRATSALKALEKSDKVVNSVEKRVSYYALV